jgi:predicted RND superfamily exporter protein
MAIAIAAIFDFRNLRDVLLAMIPPIAGGLLMFGFLAYLEISLNPANLIVLPLVLGIGVDDGVHVIHDYRAQGKNYRTSPSTMNAIVLTSLTSMIGFGSMMVAAHRGLYSVGLVLVIGVGSCLFVSLVTLPALLTLLSRQESVAEQASSPEKQQQQAPRKSQAA